MTETHGLGSYVNAAISFVRTHVAENKVPTSACALGLLVARNYLQSWTVALLVGAATYTIASRVTQCFLTAKALDVSSPEVLDPFGSPIIKGLSYSSSNTPINTPLSESLSAVRAAAPIPSLVLEPALAAPASPSATHALGSEPYRVTCLFLKGRLVMVQDQTTVDDFDAEVAALTDGVNKATTEEPPRQHSSVSPTRRKLPTPQSARSPYKIVGPLGW